MVFTILYIHLNSKMQQGQQEDDYIRKPKIVKKQVVSFNKLMFFICA